ncbi:MAG: hypothetical protein US62_C0045G0005 [Candidatus Woesebacteria bacterium GW2011_GWA1_37_8]|uniref:Uncharacterized protein n=1 Tax=Candidatus Woesebacteria bacterium GW2011_GWA1_37_8 TaxID=1618546 RepID=A0A0G0HKF0_9BACT|nr:MAG: hypothetical protein US62_C0045G0005 [Candidatus Woesebacteria bacterium GW2011_GWA1_37_8]
MQIFSKRKRFVIASVLLSIGFLGIQALPEAFRFISIGILGIFTLIFFILSLWEGLSRDLTLLTLILPFFYTVAIGFFWFLLPSSIFAKFPVIILYGIGIYALNLTMNIYTVSAIRTIALLRAARGVGFVLTLFIYSRNNKYIFYFKLNYDRDCRKLVFLACNYRSRILIFDINCVCDAWFRSVQSRR